MDILHDARYWRSLRTCRKALRAVTRGNTAQPAAGAGGPALCRALPHGTDWAWRPEVWTTPLTEPATTSVASHFMLGREVTVFHDCPRAQIDLCQARNPDPADRAALGLHIDVSGFDGSFLSLVLDLPRPALAGLTRQHLVRLDAIVAPETPLRIFARLNVQHGPNTEQITRELPLDAPAAAVEFDLAYSKLNENRLQRAWIDLILETPQTTQVALRDIMFSRRLRASL
ncbi:DUF6478 family protein [Roseovarius sp. D22-M7]|uniref:DUF6478 family protein n=1 Tax=Roseovarius sp. D22-M7 TaxID=3127116 RepID=UPI003010320D